MLNLIWAAMILIAVFFAACTGRITEVTNAFLSSSKEAVSLCITMIGVMSFWVGIMEIALDAGVVRILSKKLNPVLRFLFPNLPPGHPAENPIAVNMVSNLLGLGWAATPAGLQAMKELEKLNEDRRRGLYSGPVQKKGTASNEMCDFLIINISSLQLIPINIIGYRSQYGSVNPSGIVGAAILATTLSTLAGVLYCRLLHRNP